MALTEKDFTRATTDLRIAILDMVENAQSGHIDSSFSCVEIITTLYHDVMEHDPADPLKADRDRFILAKGHAAPALYGTLAAHGYFDSTELATLRRLRSRLQGHPKVGLPGIEVSTGSLGQALSVASGAALSLQRSYTSSTPRVFTLMGDGELDEGQVWEAMMFAGHQKLGNLVAIIDGNKLQYTGATTDVVSVKDIPAAVRSFGWDYIEIDGHDHNSILSALGQSCHERKAPLFVYANTLKGKDGLFVENDLAWHGKVPTSDQIETIRTHLRSKNVRKDFPLNA